MINQTNPMKPKKIRTYKGKRIERDETDRERKDRLLPGYDDLKRLSIGVAQESEDEEGSLIDDDNSEEPEGDETDSLIPLRWAKLASSDVETQKAMKQTIQEARDRKASKPNCEPGNSWHKSDGTWGSAETAASWSIGNKPGVGKSDCQYGKKRKSGSGRSTAFTKRECGREDVEDPNDKAKHRCKDGSVVKESDDDVLDQAWERTTSDVFGNEIADRLQKILDNHPNFIKHLTYLLKPLVDKENKDEMVKEEGDRP